MESVTVHMQLRRPSDQEVSESMDFRYLPDDKGEQWSPPTRDQLTGRSSGSSSSSETNYFFLILIDPYGYNEKKRRRENIMRISGLSSKRTSVISGCVSRLVVGCVCLGFLVLVRDGEVPACGSRKPGAD